MTTATTMVDGKDECECGVVWWRGETGGGGGVELESKVILGVAEEARVGVGKGHVADVGLVAGAQLGLDRRRIDELQRLVHLDGR